MKLYIGGTLQGQEELARKENREAEIIPDFHLLLKGFNGDPRAFAEHFYHQHPDTVVFADEIACGVVPVDRNDRAWREAAGRALCVLAQKSESVTRVICGIGVRIK